MTGAVVAGIVLVSLDVGFLLGLWWHAHIDESPFGGAR